MKGFDPKFRDFPDYIVGITKEIWEDRGIATLHDYYGEDIVVRSPALLYVNPDRVVNINLDIARRLGIEVDEDEVSDVN